jgi:hypothetical protein
MPLSSREGSFPVHGGMLRSKYDHRLSNASDRPITAYGAIDLPTYFLDLSPFVPILADGKSHNITIDVASAESDHSILQNWFVSGLLQVITDSSSKPTTGQITSYTADPYAESSISGTVGDGDVNITVSATRKIHIEANILSGSGQLTHVIWSQDLQYTNIQNYLENATIQVCLPYYLSLHLHL